VTGAFIFLVILCAPVGIVAFAAFWLPERIDARNTARQLREDTGAVVYERIVEMLETRSDEWKKDAQNRWFLPGTTIIITGNYYPTVHIGKSNLMPGEAWKNVIGKALSKIEDGRQTAEALHAVCDAIETMAADNVIPMKRRTGT
jgi:hypothetical protein